MGSISYDLQSFLINGERRLLLIGTVNYFRLHPGDWEHRLRLFKQSGFNTVDTYVAWGYHEPIEGQSDFESPARDLDRYLSLCGSLRLFVYFRPGPYICNEFDGGGLPPWLYLKSGVDVRQNDENYLAIVKRYLSQVNKIATRHQFTRGGPIILYAIENELDFYPTRDVAGYMTALRDHVRADGIEVPLTACVGQRTPIERAMGLIDHVIPTPNIYVGGDAVEREATAALEALHAARSVTGKPYDVPPFVTEMGRDENSLRRILSAGFKGLGPFNFAGGSNWDRYHAVNNWGDYKQLCTSIDFGGMIAFDGTIGQTYFDARRLARFIACIEPELTIASPRRDMTRVVDGSKAVQPHTLASEHGTFVFVPNLTDEPLSIALEVGGRRIPSNGTLTISPKKTPIITAGLSLKRLGINAAIAYSTAEFWTLERRGEAVQMELLLREGQQGEIAFSTSREPIRLAVGTMQDLVIDGERIALRVLEESVTERGGIEGQLQLGEPQDLLCEPWSISAKPIDSTSIEWTGELRSLDSLGVLYGAGEYETTILGAERIRSIAIDYAADHISFWIDDRFHGTRLCDGNAWKATVDLAPRRHRLRIRAAGWGRPCFHDAKWPAARLGAPRGLAGRFEVNDQPVAASWRFVPDPVVPPASDSEGAPATLGSLRIEGGESRIARWTIRDDEPQGAVLELSGRDLEGRVIIDDEGVGRFGFGPMYRYTGGPSDRILLPGGLLKRGATLTLILRGTQPDAGAFDRFTLRPLRFSRSTS